MRHPIALSLLCIALGLSANAQTTTFTYEYDKYGQLTASSRSTGHPNHMQYDYDLVGNRTKVKKGVSGVTAYDDWTFVVIDPVGTGWVLSPLDNDTDDDLPNDTLTITGLSGTDSQWATILPGGQSIGFYENDTGGYYTFGYTVSDKYGNIDTATIEVYVIWPFI